MNTKKINYKPAIIWIFFAHIMFYGVFLTLVKYTYKIDFKKTYLFFVDQLYLSGPNSSITHTSEPFWVAQFQFIIFICIALGISLIMILRFLLNNRFCFGEKFRAYLLIVATCSFFLYTIVQFNHKLFFLWNVQLSFAEKTLFDKYAQNGIFEYEFAQHCKTRLPYYVKPQLLTDEDLPKSDKMLNHRLLAYFLYPEVSIRYENEMSENGLLLFHKNNAKEYIPHDYKIVCADRTHTYILAVKDVQQ